MKKNNILIGLLALSIQLFPSAGFTDNAPRDYLPAPPGTQLLFSSYEVRTGDDLYSKRGKSTQPTQTTKLSIWLQNTVITASLKIGIP